MGRKDDVGLSVHKDAKLACMGRKMARVSLSAKARKACAWGGR
jgi:hypothetical protein